MSKGEGRSEAIFEIRNYTIDRRWFDAYKKWAAELAAPLVKAKLDVVDIWVDDGMESEVSGSAPAVSPNGQPNSCWIIRWPSQAARAEGVEALVESSEFQEMWAKHPNPDAYLDINVRFMKAATDLPFAD